MQRLHNEHSARYKTIHPRYTHLTIISSCESHSDVWFWHLKVANRTITVIHTDKCCIFFWLVLTFVEMSVDFWTSQLGQYTDVTTPWVFHFSHTLSFFFCFFPFICTFCLLSFTLMSCHDIYYYIWMPSIPFVVFSLFLLPILIFYSFLSITFTFISLCPHQKHSRRLLKIAFVLINSCKAGWKLH